MAIELKKSMKIVSEFKVVGLPNTIETIINDRKQNVLILKKNSEMGGCYKRGFTRISPWATSIYLPERVKYE